MGFWSTITGTTDQDTQQAQLDAKKQAFNDALQRRQDSGNPVSPDQEASLRTYVDALTLDDTTAAAEQGFVEGAKEGLNNVLEAPGKAVGGIGSGLSRVVGGVLKNVPAWIYVVVLGGLAVWLFVYMGGLFLLKGRLARS